MTLQLLHSEFPFIGGIFYFILYQCRKSRDRAGIHDSVVPIPIIACHIHIWQHFAGTSPRESYNRHFVFSILFFS
jgi:hypothetical protein